MYTPESLFAEIVRLLTERHNPVIVDAWAGFTRAIAIRDGSLVLVADNFSIQGFVIRQWLTRIMEAMSELTDEKLAVTVLCGKSEEQAWRAARDDMAFGGYTFEHFIVGKSNEFAYAAAKAVAENPAIAYNPLLIYGGSGLGKTHLLYSIASKIRNDYPDHQITYIKGDTFTNELVEAIQSGTVAEFRQRYRNIDLLLVDDIQFISGKERTQEEFFHTFNSLHEAGKQIVLTADRPPKEMHTLSERLKTRFEWGLLADVQAPDLETRMALVSAKADALGLNLTKHVIEFVANSITNNVRQLEGALKKIQAYNQIMHEDVTMPMVERAIQDIIRVNPGLNPTSDLIIREVCSYYNVERERMLGVSKSKEIAIPRQIMFYLIRSMTSLSLPEIGKEVKRDHSTVLYSINKIEEQIKTDEALVSTLNDIKKNIRNAE